jgi:tripartite ATP-independent transporter DctP family solute receptor
MRRWAYLLIGLATLALLPDCGKESSGRRRIRLSLILAKSSEWYQGAMRWKELVEKETQGRYVVEVIPNAERSTANQSTELQMVQRGQLEASLESTILLSTVDSRWAVFSYPWLFPNHAIANAVCDGPVGEEMLKLLLDRNIVGLAYGANGFRQITNSRRPIKAAEDLVGMKIRVPPGLPPILFGHFGAITDQMNFTDLSVALQSGALDGQENPLSVIQNAQLHTVQKYVTLWGFVYDPIVLCMSRDFWYTLPGDDQRILRKCAVEAMRYERQLVAEADAAIPPLLEKAGMVVTRLTDLETGAFRAKASGVRPYFEKLAGKELLQRFESAVKEEIEKARAKALEEAAEKR